jgi:hypothetical protein
MPSDHVDLVDLHLAVQGDGEGVSLLEKRVGMHPA